MEKDGNLSDDEWGQITALLSGYSGGYCLGGRASENEQGQAWQILWSPTQRTSDIVGLKPEEVAFWGVPQIMQRLIFGFDQDVLAKILASGHWNADPSVLYDLIAEQQLIQPSLLPIREAIDWIHTVIHTTIRGTKFAKWPHFCGGPVEIAVITNDRPFRWVKHKEMSAAILSQ